MRRRLGTRLDRSGSRRARLASAARHGRLQRSKPLERVVEFEQRLPVAERQRQQFREPVRDPGGVIAPLDETVDLVRLRQHQKNKKKKKKNKKKKKKKKKKKEKKKNKKLTLPRQRPSNPYHYPREDKKMRKKGEAGLPNQPHQLT
jgi:hypothetical protein